MKSLMEEASSISKAIEKGWTNAGKPKEFTIKVYEEPEKNFIGMTTKPAKIGIFFNEPKQPATDTRRTKQRNPVAQAPRTPERVPKEPRKEPKPQEERAPRKQEDLGPIWDDSMVQSTKAWLTEMLTHMNLGTSSFTIEPDRFHLKINFKQNLLEDRDRQKHLFAVFSGLLLSMLKRQCKRPLRGYKIVLTQE
jgi:predicted RNA-binding protein Jag